MYRYLIGVLLVLSLVACNWGSARSLGGNYYLDNGDPDHVYLSKKLENEPYWRVVVEQQIVDYEIKNDYLLVLRKVAHSYDCYNEENVPTIITRYSNKDEYWIIGLKTGEEIGPLTFSAFEERQEKLELERIRLNAPNNYYSNTDVFEEWRKQCDRFN